jgi:hypothetical protein
VDQTRRNLTLQTSRLEFFLFSFVIIITIIIVLEVHYDIYQSAYNTS